jgi:hypothetical protein
MKFGLSPYFAEGSKIIEQHSRHYGSFEKRTETLTTDLQTFKITREINNHIVYNLKQLKYHESA